MSSPPPRLPALYTWCVFLCLSCEKLSATYLKQGCSPTDQEKFCQVKASARVIDQRALVARQPVYCSSVCDIAMAPPTAHSYCCYGFHERTELCRNSDMRSSGWSPAERAVCGPLPEMTLSPWNRLTLTALIQEKNRRITIFMRRMRPISDTGRADQPITFTIVQKFYIL